MPFSMLERIGGVPRDGFRPNLLHHGAMGAPSPHKLSALRRADSLSRGTQRTGTQSYMPSSASCAMPPLPTTSSMRAPTTLIRQFRQKQWSAVSTSVAGRVTGSGERTVLAAATGEGRHGSGVARRILSDEGLEGGPMLPFLAASEAYWKVRFEFKEWCSSGCSRRRVRAVPGVHRARDCHTVILRSDEP